MRVSAPLVSLALVLVVVGALVLRAAGRDARASPVVSSMNGGPRGLLALARLLDGDARAVARRLRHDASWPPADVLVVPPPESAHVTRAEALLLLARVDAGAHLVVLCDDDDARNARLAELMRESSMRCVGDEGPRDGKERSARPLFLDADSTVARFTGGTVDADPTAASAPLVVDERGAVLARTSARGAGAITFASAALFANDALARADNAAFALALLGGAQVAFVESHHAPRRAEVLRAAFARTGPVGGALALTLALVALLLGAFPRAGDAPARTTRPPSLTARASIHLRAALYRRALSPTVYGAAARRDRGAEP